MNHLKISSSVNLWGFQVLNFPQGVEQAFDTLVQLVPDGLDRAYYGLSYMENEKVIYIAAAAENFPGEAEKHNCERYTIDEGEYATVTVHDWKEKTHTIKDIFGEMIGEGCPTKDRPAIEWYKNEDEMLCMIKIETGVHADK